MPLIDLQIMCCLKKLEVWAVTTVMMSVIISVKISVDFVHSFISLFSILSIYRYNLRMWK
jgi:hypothetical protein